MTPILAFCLGILATLAILALRARFATFSAQRPGDYVTQTPAFDLTRHLNGPLVMEGVIYGPTGRVTSRFVADAQGQWDGPVGTLSETFRFDSGTVQNRAWSLRLGPDGSITATAGDVIGVARGRVAGSGVMMQYRIRLAPEAGSHVLTVTDWMYLMPNGTVMNRSEFTKFGLKVAELVATIRPAPVERTQDIPRLAAE